MPEFYMDPNYYRQWGGGTVIPNVPTGPSVITGSFTDFAPANNTFCIRLRCNNLHDTCSFVYCLLLPNCSNSPPNNPGGMIIELIENNKTVIKTETDKEGNYTLPEIPDGKYKVRISDSKGNEPKLIMMTIEEFSFAVQPPVSKNDKGEYQWSPESISLVFGDDQNPNKGSLYFKKRKHNYKGTVTLVKQKSNNNIIK